MKKLIKIAFISALVLFAHSSFAQNAKIITYRKGCIYGALAKYKVKIDGNEMAELKGTSIYTASVTPGTHTVSAKQPKRMVTIEAKAGETYVVKYASRFGFFGVRPKLKIMTVAEAMKDSKYFKNHYNQ